jgi:hypothetical protein
MKIRCALSLCLLGACSGAPVDDGPIAPDRPILEWTAATASDANAANLPAGFSGPDVHSCAKDPTHEYIKEIFDNGLNDIEVNYHWAPIVSGPNPALPTLNQPEFSLSGAVINAVDSTDDVLADHPFGFDFTFDVNLDAPFTFFHFSHDGPPGTVHAEIEQRIIPRTPLGFNPTDGDRTILRGVWVLDCGHPPYGAEIHPPSFLAFARQSDAQTSIGMAVMVPYRSSLLFNPDVSFATAFDDQERFNDVDTRPFPHALVQAVLSAVATKADHLESHALMIPNRIDSIHWHQCAPLPRPAGARLDASWHFTARTGVTIQASLDDASGCVRFIATMGSDYTPMALPYADADWPWAALSASASGQLGQPIDVRMAIIQDLGSSAASAPALQVDHPPRVDAYAALQPRAGADGDAPTAIDAHADDQPFPFYGRARVAWK